MAFISVDEQQKSMTFLWIEEIKAPEMFDLKP
jgi:hypothetical protein